MQTDGNDARIRLLRQRLAHWELVIDLQPWNKGAEETYARILGEYELLLGEVEVLDGSPRQEAVVQ